MKRKTSRLRRLRKSLSALSSNKSQHPKHCAWSSMSWSISELGEWSKERGYVCIYDTIWCFEFVSEREKSLPLARDMGLRCGLTEARSNSFDVVHRKNFPPSLPILIWVYLKRLLFHCSEIARHLQAEINSPHFRKGVPAVLASKLRPQQKWPLIKVLSF